MSGVDFNTAAVAVAVGASKPQRAGYGPGFVPPPYPGAPPIPLGVQVNPQQWQNGGWDYNPAYEPPARSSAPTQQNFSWMPGQAWQLVTAKQQVRVAHPAHPAQPYNPPPPSAEYLAQPLISNPLGLWELSKGERQSMTTPWIWNPAKLRQDKDSDSDDTDEDTEIASDDDHTPDPGQKEKDYTAKVELRPTFSPSIVRTPFHYQDYQKYPDVAPNPPQNPNTHPPHPTQTQRKPSPPRFLDARQYVLSEESEGIEGILSPLTIFDTAPLPSFTNPFRAADPQSRSSREHRDHNQNPSRHDHKPPRPSGLGRTSYTPPDAALPPPSSSHPYPSANAHPSAYPYTSSPAYPRVQLGSGSYDDHEHDSLHDEHHLPDAAVTTSGSSRRDRDRDQDRERAEQKETERRLKTARDADRPLKASAVQQPVSQGLLEEASSSAAYPPQAYPNPAANTQVGSNAGASAGSGGQGQGGRELREGTPTPNQQQAAQYAHARAQQERRQQEYKYYRALERSRSGKGGPADVPSAPALNGDHSGDAERERERTGLRPKPTLEAILSSESSSTGNKYAPAKLAATLLSWKESQLNTRPPPPHIPEIVDPSYSRSLPSNEHFALSSAHQTPRQQPHQYDPTPLSSPNISLPDYTGPDIAGPNFNPIADRLARAESVISSLSSHGTVTTDYGSIFASRTLSSPSTLRSVTRWR